MSLARIPRTPKRGIADWIKWAIFRPEPNLPADRPSPDNLPPTVNRPGQQIRHFPKALDPDRSFAYSKKIEKARKPTNIVFRVFAVATVLGGLGLSYYLILVRDWDDRVFGATWRRDRLKRIALHRELTPDEAAILARPEPIHIPLHGPIWLLKQVPFNMAMHREMKKAAREKYLEDRRLEAAGLDVPIRGGKVNYKKYGMTAADAKRSKYKMISTDVDDDLDWDTLTASEEDVWE